MKPRLLDLPHGYQTLVDEEDWERLCTVTLYRGSNGYVYYSTWENGRSVPRTLHSLLVGSHPGMHVDHINGDKLDNRRSNLRVVTPSQNQINRKGLNRNNRSGIRGVSQAWGKWRAQIMANGKVRHLGLFLTREEAIAARRHAERDLWGEEAP